MAKNELLQATRIIIEDIYDSYALEKLKVVLDLGSGLHSKASMFLPADRSKSFIVFGLIRFFSVAAIGYRNPTLFLCSSYLR